jgi:hypothetical protein
VDFCLSCGCPLDGKLERGFFAPATTAIIYR